MPTLELYILRVPAELAPKADPRWAENRGMREGQSKQEGCMRSSARARCLKRCFDLGVPSPEEHEPATWSPDLTPMLLAMSDPWSLAGHDPYLSCGAWDEGVKPQMPTGLEMLL